MVFYIVHINEKKVCRLEADIIKEFVCDGHKTVHGYEYGLYGKWGTPTEYNLKNLNKRIIFDKKKDAEEWLNSKLN